MESAKVLRERAKEYLDNYLFDTAVFYARQALDCSDAIDEDWYLMAKGCHRKGQHKRCIWWLEQRNLVPEPNERGILDEAFQMCAARLRPGARLGTLELKALNLASNAYSECGELDSAVLMLGADDSTLWTVLKKTIESSRRSLRGASASPLLVSSLCLSRAIALERLGRIERALHWYRYALRCDPLNREALSRMVRQSAVRLSEAKSLLTELRADKTKRLPQWLDAEYCDCVESIVPNAESGKKRGSEERLSVWTARKLAMRGSFESALDICTATIAGDPLDVDCNGSAVQVSSLFALRRGGELLNAARELLSTAPQSAVGWYAAGLYYLMHDRYSAARGLLSKAMKLKDSLADAWLAYGDCFADDDSHEMALKAYRGAHRMFPASHTAVLRIARQYAHAEKYSIALSFLQRVADSYAATGDPLLWNELGVVALSDDRIADAKAYFEKAVRLATNEDCNGPQLDTVAFTAFVNLGHCLRRDNALTEALRCYERAYALRRSAQVLNAMALTHLQMGAQLPADAPKENPKAHSHKALAYLHSSLSLEPHNVFAAQCIRKMVQESFDDENHDDDTV